MYTPLCLSITQVSFCEFQVKYNTTTFQFRHFYQFMSQFPFSLRLSKWGSRHCVFARHSFGTWKKPGVTSTLYKIRWGLTFTKTSRKGKVDICVVACCGHHDMTINDMSFAILRVICFKYSWFQKHKNAHLSLSTTVHM